MKKFNDYNKGSKDSKDEVESTDSNNSLIENFSKKYGLLNNNVENSNNTVKLFEDMFSKLDQYVKKDEISEFLFSQIVVLKEQFEEFKTNVNSLNNQKNQEISNVVEDVVNKANYVIDKVDNESKTYKKKYFEDNLVNEEKFKEIDSKFDQIEYQTILEKIESFNESLLGLQEVVDTTLPQQDKKVEKFIIENEEAVKNVNKTSEKLQLAVTEILKDFETKLESLSETFLTSDSLDSTNKKYNKKIVEVHNQFEKIRKDFTKVDNHYTLSKDQFKDIGDKLNSLTENIFAVEQRIKGERDKQNYKIVEADTKLDKKIEDVKADVDNVTSDVSNLKETVISDLEKVENNLSEIVSKDIKDAKDQLEEKITKAKLDQHKVDAKLKKTFNEEFKSVKKDIRSADTKINNQLNKYKLLEEKTKSIITDVKNVFKDKKFVDLNKKITFIEETLEKFNEKTVLTEELVNNPAETNKDPLTPLNQNFVTFDQLKKHYQLFINRIQQQLMSVGGGGAVRIDQLDDVDHNSVLNAQNGQALVFITTAAGGNNKFEVRTVATGGSVGGANANVNTVGGAQGDISNAQISTFAVHGGIFNNGNTLFGDLDGAVKFDAKAGENLSKGNVVYISGISGNRPVVNKANAGDSSKMPAFGLIDADTTINGACNVITFGTLSDFKTDQFSLGDTLYVDVNGGGLSNTKPTGESSLLQNIGKVQRSHSSAGSIKVGGAGRSAATPNLNDGNIFMGNIANCAAVVSFNNQTSAFLTELTGNIVPAADNVSSLGSETNRFKDLFLSGNTFVLGGLTLKDTGGALAVTDSSDATILDASQATPALSQADLTIANIAGYAANLDTRFTGANIGGALTGGTDIEITAGGTINYTGSGGGGGGVTSVGGATGAISNAQIGLFADVSQAITIGNVSGYAANLDTRFTGANIGGALTGGTDIEITAGGTINFTGSGGSGVPSVGGATGAISNAQIGLFADVSQAITIGNIAGYAANIDSRLTIANVSGYHANLESELTTANVSEVTNLYYTDARSRGAISTTGGSRNYNSSTGVITIPDSSDDVTEGSTNLFYANGRANSTLVANLNYANVDYMSNLVGSTTQIQLTSEKNFIRFYAANQSAFPAAATFHGAIMHSHADAAMYFAHGGAWVKMIDTVSLASNIDSRLTIANVSGYHANLESELTTANVSAAGAADGELYFSNARANLAIAANVHHSMKQHMVMALSAEGGDLATSANVLIFRAPEAMSLYKIPRISCNVAPDSAIEVGIQKNGTDIFTTNLTIDANETSSKTAATDAVLSSTPYLIADDDQITVDINSIGSSTKGSGLKLTLYYTVTE